MQIWKNRIPKGSSDEIQSNSSLIQGEWREYSSSNNITNLETEAMEKKIKMLRKIWILLLEYIIEPGQVLLYFKTVLE